MLKELQQLEVQFPEYKRKDSPTFRVGGSISKEFPTVTHQFPMLSLDNTYSDEELVKFDERVQKGLGTTDYEYVCELKFDGVALSVRFEEGVQICIVTASWVWETSEHSEGCSKGTECLASL